MPHEEKYLHLSQSEHEEIATGFLVRFRDAQRDRVLSGQLDPDEPCGSQAKMIDELLFCFFDDKRGQIGLEAPSPMMSVSELADFVNDEALSLIADHRPDLLTRDWQGNWQLTDSDDADFDLNLESGDDDEYAH